ncbi:hypothetical protein AAY473_008049 [Plecturocebus cupreus]
MSLLKIQKNSWVWWYMPVIPATWEAEAEESLEPERQMLHLNPGEYSPVTNPCYGNHPEDSARSLILSPRLECSAWTTPTSSSRKPPAPPHPPDPRRQRDLPSSSFSSSFSRVAYLAPSCSRLAPPLTDQR